MMHKSFHLYLYPSSSNILFLYYTALTNKQISNLRRLPFSGLSSRGLKLFKVSLSEQKRAAAVEKKSVRVLGERQRKDFKKSLKGVEKTLGIRLPQQVTTSRGSD